MAGFTKVAGIQHPGNAHRAAQIQQMAAEGIVEFVHLSLIHI